MSSFEGGAGNDEGDQADEDAGNTMRGAVARSVLDHIARSIVDDPESVSIHTVETRRGVDLSLSVAQSDMGKIIGRRGRVAQAIRALVRAAGARERIEATVDIVD